MSTISGSGSVEVTKPCANTVASSQLPITTKCLRRQSEFPIVEFNENYAPCVQNPLCNGCNQPKFAHEK